MDEELLRELVAVAVAQASADEVTAPVTETNAWSPERVEWFESYHRSCRAGLNSGRRELTWGVTYDGAAIGAVRLKRTDDPSILETGIWLARDVRGKALAVPAMQLVLDQARRLGASAVIADTAATNTAARASLERLGLVATAASGGRVTARYEF